MKCKCFEFGLPKIEETNHDQGNDKIIHVFILWMASIFLFYLSVSDTHFKHVRQVFCHCVWFVFFPLSLHLILFFYHRSHFAKWKFTCCLHEMCSEWQQSGDLGTIHEIYHGIFNLIYQTEVKWKTINDRRCRLASSTKLLKVYETNASFQISSSTPKMW